MHCAQFVKYLFLDCIPIICHLFFVGQSYNLTDFVNFTLSISNSEPAYYKLISLDLHILIKKYMPIYQGF